MSWKAFLTSFTTCLLACGAVFLGIVLLMIYSSASGGPGDNGAGWMVLFFVVGLGPWFLAGSVVVSAIIALIFTMISGQKRLESTSPKFGLGRVVLYSVLVIFALLAGLLKLSGI